MSIENCRRGFMPVCDVCGNELPPEDDFHNAVREKKEAGWASRKVNGEWEDVCDDCLAEEGD